MKAMLRYLIACIAVVALDACSSVVVSDPSDDAVTHAKASVPSLGDLLTGDDGKPVEKVKVILIHGIGDHCPGYGLNTGTGTAKYPNGDKSSNAPGWFSDKTTAKLRLVPESDLYPNEPVDLLGNVPVYDIPSCLFTGGSTPGCDPKSKSKVSLSRRHFKYQTPDNLTVHVEIDEITWSALTQWIKTQQLGYDLSKPGQVDNAASTWCVDAPSDRDATATRVYINASLKEGVMDRNIADAVLYIGSYGVSIQRGVAEALCWAMQEKNPDGKTRCTWNAPAQDDKTRYVFITHSLGSRILYDTLVDMLSKQANGNRQAFSPAESETIRPYAQHIMDNTAVIYMMANQLSMLQLAEANPLSQPAEVPSPASAPSAEPDLAAKQQFRAIFSPPAISAANAAGSQGASANVVSANTVSNGGELRFDPMSYFTSFRTNAKPLPIVAFSDPNDLLSWGVPWWWHTQAQSNVTAKFQFTNVFVQNSPWWLFAFEWPTDAHDDYFMNSGVIDVIRCGVKDGKVAC